MDHPCPRLSVIIPVYNEERLVQASVEAMHAGLLARNLPFEIVLVNDGSKDASPLLMDQLASRLEGVRVRHQENRGIGGAFRTGLTEARGEYCMLWPADMLATDAGLAPYTDSLGRADVIVGCRRQRLAYNWLMRINAKIYPLLIRLLFGLRLRDVNWICVYRRAPLAAIPLTQTGIPMLAEMLVRLRDRQATFLEIDVDMQVRTAGKPSAARLVVMRRTLLGLLRFWLLWRRERKTAARP
jgi:glycosyltransferase involved in cell wall biosynthesis